MKPLKEIKYYGPVQITWILNQSCPSHCWYCPDHIHRGRNNNFDWDTCSKFLDFLINKYPHANISLSGGEPTTWPYFEQLIDKVLLEGRKITVSVNSNLVRTRDWWGRMAPKLAGVSASYHPDVVKTDEERQDWFDKLDYVAAQAGTNLRVMMDPKHWDHCVEVIERLRTRTDSLYGVEPVRLLNYFEGFHVVNYDVDYTPEQDHNLGTMNYFPPKINPPAIQKKQFQELVGIVHEDGSRQRLEHVGPLVLNKMNKFKGWQCNIGIESLYISPDGHIKRGNCFEGAIIGNVLEPEKIIWADKAVECSYEMCHCLTDIRISKWRP